MWLLASIACSTPQAPSAPEPAPVATAPAPAPAPAAPAQPRCDAAVFTPLVQGAEGIADELREKARVKRPVCKDGLAYAQIGFGKGEEGATVLLAHQNGSWNVLELGSGVDCAEPPAPMTAEACADLEKSWAEQKKEGPGAPKEGTPAEGDPDGPHEG
jgi:hypothetical protein